MKHPSPGRVEPAQMFCDFNNRYFSELSIRTDAIGAHRVRWIEIVEFLAFIAGSDRHVVGVHAIYRLLIYISIVITLGSVNLLDQNHNRFISFQIFDLCLELNQMQCESFTWFPCVGTQPTSTEWINSIVRRISTIWKYSGKAHHFLNKVLFSKFKLILVNWIKLYIFYLDLPLGICA